MHCFFRRSKITEKYKKLRHKCSKICCGPPPAALPAPCYHVLGERAFAAWSLPPEQIRVVVTLIVCTLRGLRMQHILDPNDDTAVAVKQALVEAVQQILTHNQTDARDSDAGLKRRQA